MDLTLFALQKVTVAGKSMTIADLFMPPAKVAFFDDGTGPKPTLWNVDGVTAPTEAEVTAAAAAPNPPPTQAQLLVYAPQSQVFHLESGQTFNVAASGASVNVLCDGTNNTRADLAMLALFGQQAPAGTKTWVDNNGIATTLTGTQLIALATLAGTWIDDTYAALATIVGAITNGAITTIAQIDAAFAAVPATRS